MQKSSAAIPPLQFGIGIEGTHEPVSGRDTLAITGHYRRGRWWSDFQLVRQLRVSEVRYPIPWHRIEARKGRYDWRAADVVLASAVQDHRVQIIADTLHHTSYPQWLRGGFADEDFRASYVRFVRSFALRYPQVRIFTPFNEPTCTLDFCGSRGIWHPYGKGDDSYVKLLRHAARATAEAIHAIRAVRSDAYILHVDTFQHHAAIDDASRSRASFFNERRFIFDDLLLGRVDASHPLCSYLRQHGFSAQDLDWHQGNPARYDERGGNYYPLNEEQLEAGATRHAPSLEPRGFAEVAKDYASRLRLPLSLTETNIQGSIRDRVSWLKYMLEQAEMLGRYGVPLRRFAWYPLFDCAGWNTLLHGKEWQRDPQGIFSCGPHWERLPTELSQLYANLSEGAGSDSLPAYEFGPHHDRTLGALKRQMNWNWIPQDTQVSTSEPVAAKARERAA